MTTAKKPVRRTIAKKSGANAKGKAAVNLKAAAAIIQLVEGIIPPEAVDQAMNWLKEQHFSDKFIELTKQIRLPDKKDPLSKVENQCKAVEELIETRSSVLADDAPISQWRLEVEKIRAGVELVRNAAGGDLKMRRELEKRAGKLYDSAFKAALGK
ncbi:hypothetical protein GA0061078_0467 [Bifidobacterium bohemicum]|uniref:Uncharacterized protein n=2 Tax=Bifidobacterium bohemicum TaxID=638617 RepID=A0A086ZJL4_9BIFI|nr:hypothetical protein BBOH_0186 [Bifidobacterium bohemicum DSM 22767]SCB79558.1 hypothetical protein GA0061078_0467 [Bifidobacterium bohemicum]